MTEKRHPQVFVQLTGEDGSTGSIMGRVSKALTDDGLPTAEVNEFRRQIFNADSYDHVIRIVSDWVEVG